MSRNLLPTPVIFGHRGASALAPENTVAAFQLARSHGAPAVELDAKLSSDRQVVVIHDQTVDRTTNGHGKVMDLTLDQLKSLDAGSWFGPDYAGEPIPTLAEVFSAVGGQIWINIELTNYTTPNDALVDEVVKLIQVFGIEDKVLFSSFNPITLLKARRLMPGVPAAILALEGRQGDWARGLLGRWVAPAIVHPYFSDVSRLYIKQQHAISRRVHTWTVNNPEEMRRLFAIGVDGLFTDDPRLALSILST